MKLVNVGAAVLNQTPLDWEGNRRRIVEVLREARRRGVSILCLPELCITGYGCEDAFLSTYVHSLAAQVLSEILPETTGMVVSLGLPVLFRNAMFNTACLVADGEIVGFVGKRFLAGDGLHYEPRWFKPWPQWAVGEVDICGDKHPLGDVYFDCGGVKIGFEICEDAWVANRPGAELARRGMDVILNPSASHFAFGKIDVRKRFVQEGSRAFGVSYVYANLLGNEAGRTVYDGGAIIATRGNITAVGERFSFAEWGLTTCLVDIDETRLGHARTHSYQPLLSHDEMVCVSVPFDYPVIEPEHADPPRLAAWEKSDHRKEEEFTRAMALGLFDYMRKSRSNGFVVSLSGGADSAAVAALAAYMVHRAIEDVGVDGLLQRVPWLASNEDPTALEKFKERDFVTRLLTCVYQSTRNSSETTRGAAEGVASALGATYWEFDVDALVLGYTDIVAKSLGRSLGWQTDDVALQNIQARVRSPGVWMVANIKSALLLATSNRSEAAVGYATMDGDTSGGLSPIAGIDKAFLRQWLRWMQNYGPLNWQPIPALDLVNRQQPTAELRPSAAKQTDEDDLMPYPVLDAIEGAAIREKQSPSEILALLRREFTQYDVRQMGLWIERFFRLWSRNQWKRERYAPSFHVDDKNLDPKTWCRFPILSGGFELELKQLRQLVEDLAESASPADSSGIGSRSSADRK